LSSLFISPKVLFLGTTKKNVWVKVNVTQEDF